MSFRIINGKVVPLEIPVQSKVTSINRKSNGPDFNDILRREIDRSKEVKISGHAMERMKQRNIELNKADMEKLSEAIEKAEAKGGRESLIFYNDIAFIASIRNKTIITVVDKESTRGNVFTNIDSAVII